MKFFKISFILGARVLIASRSEEKLRKAVERITRDSGVPKENVSWTLCNLRKEEQV